MKKLIDRILNYYGYYKKMPRPMIIEKVFKPMRLRESHVVSIGHYPYLIPKEQRMHMVRDEALEAFCKKIKPFVKVNFSHEPYDGHPGFRFIEIELIIYQPE